MVEWQKGVSIIKVLLSFLAGIIAGWHLHSYSGDDTLPLAEKAITKPEPKRELPSERNNSKKSEKKREFSAEKVLPAPSVDSNSSSSEVQSTFEVLLGKHLFDEAMELYMDADEKDIPGYKEALIDYFGSRMKSSPGKSAEEMLQYLDIEPDSREVQYLLVHLYMQEKAYPKAIDLIMELRENYLNEADDKRLETLLKTSAERSIDRMKKNKNFGALAAFLERMIEYGFSENYYTFELARLNFDLQKYSESRMLLLQLKEDAVYERKAQNLLDKIEKLEEAAREYEYKIPLQRIGHHFSVQVMVNDTVSLNLLLDTGASYTMISSGKIPSLSILKREVRLGTAGGMITADLCLANRFSIENIELKNFKMMVAPFEQEGVDGLLGMNFFQKFKFFIDQKASLLYLSAKTKAAN